MLAISSVFKFLDDILIVLIVMPEIGLDLLLAGLALMDRGLDARSFSDIILIAILLDYTYFYWS